jgi:hypothetical protein
MSTVRIVSDVSFSVEEWKQNIMNIAKIMKSLNILPGTEETIKTMSWDT